MGLVSARPIDEKSCRAHRNYVPVGYGCLIALVFVLPTPLFVSAIMVPANQLADKYIYSRSTNQDHYLGGAMRKDLERIYRQLLYWGLVSNQFDFSTRWLGQCRSYFSSMKAREADPGSDATLALLSRLRSYNDRLCESGSPRTVAAMGQLSSMLEQEANAISEQLFDASLLRVAARQSLSRGEFS